MGVLERKEFLRLILDLIKSIHDLEKANRFIAHIFDQTQ
jgi:hypothetical protein